MDEPSMAGERGSHKPGRRWGLPLKHPGWQLAAAVVLAWALSSALRLPDGWWAVMSALIVVRRDADTTLDAGWARAQGAVLGSAVALVGVFLQAQGVAAVPVTLAVVGALAYWSTAAPGMRSSPITALIVLQASAMAGHSAWQVALLRIAEIGVGVLAALLVTLEPGRQSAVARFDARCVGLLRRWADEFPASLSTALAGQPAVDAARWRLALYQLALLGRSADRSGQWRRRWQRRAAAPNSREALARLLGRTFGDLSALVRLVALLPEGRAAPAIEALKEPLGSALRSTAEALEGKDGADLGALRQLASMQAGEAADPATASSARWLAPGVALLIQDLAALAAAAATREA